MRNRETVDKPAHLTIRFLSVFVSDCQYLSKSINMNTNTETAMLSNLQLYWYISRGNILSEQIQYLENYNIHRNDNIQGNENI